MSGGELTAFPVLEPLGVVGTIRKVVLVTVLLEEQLLVTPERGDGLGAGDNPTDEVVLATKLGRLVVGLNLEDGSVGVELGKLILEVVLVLIGPSIDIIRLKLNHERPVGLVLLLAVLIEKRHLHEGRGTDVVGGISEPFTVSLAEALILRLTKDVAPSVLEEVE